MEELQKVTVGIISNPTTDIDSTFARNMICLFLSALQTTMADSGAQEVVIVTGPTSHKVSNIVHEEVGKLGWTCVVGEQWGETPSTFTNACDIVMRVGDDADPWCKQQERLMRARNCAVCIAF